MFIEVATFAFDELAMTGVLSSYLHPLAGKEKALLSPFSYLEDLFAEPVHQQKQKNCEYSTLTPTSK